MKAPVVPPAEKQLAVEKIVVHQQVPRSIIVAGLPADVTLAPKVAVVWVTKVAAPTVTVGTEQAVGAVALTELLIADPPPEGEYD